MKSNMNATDRVTRILLAIIVAILYFTRQIDGTLALVLGIVAIIIAATAVLNFCPVYRLFGISTTKKRDNYEARN